MSGLNTFVNYRTSHHTKATKLAVREQTAYVQQRDRDEWLESHPGRPFPESMLTPAERRYEAKIRRLNTITRREMNRTMVILWIVSGVAGLFLALSGAGIVVTAVILGVMGKHHYDTAALWGELHANDPGLPATSPADLDAPTAVIAVGRHSA